MLATDFSSLLKVGEYPWSSVDTVAFCIQGADQAKESNAFDGPLTDRLLDSCAITAGIHLEYPAHRSSIEASAVGLD